MSGSSPWRFLTSLDAEDPLDRRLLAETRGDDIELVTGMVASSRASILYAHSGNGKTSLINAGIIPRLRKQGHIVVRTRPRPAWSNADPSEAFKESVLRDLSIPLFTEDDRKGLTGLGERLRQAGDEDAAALKDLLRKIDLLASRLAEPEEAMEVLRARLREVISEPIAEFLRELRRLMKSRSRLVVICDQFEELFVHYSDTTEEARFVGQLGEVWADDELNCHLLFSMREDWVGSMIAFRRAIPEIFSYYYRLTPIRRSAAGPVLELPLEGTGYRFGEKAVERILDDLTEVYSSVQRDRFGAIRLAVSPHEDPYVELPALHVVAESLWESRTDGQEPFSVGHYKAAARISASRAGSRFRRRLDPETPPEEESAAAAILDDYLERRVQALGELEGLTPEESQDLRLDCLYALTDRRQHRRALGEEQLREVVRELRASELELPEVDGARLLEAVRPMVRAGLVREFEVVAGEREFELAHDFMVRTVVHAWKDVDRDRTARVAIKLRAQEKEKTHYASLTRREGWGLRVIQIMPLVILFPLLGTLLAILAENGEAALGWSTSGSYACAIAGALILTISLLQRRPTFALTGLVGGAVGSIVLINVSVTMADLPRSYTHWEEWSALLSITALGLLMLFIPLTRSISVESGDSPPFQRFQTAIGVELWDLLLGATVTILAFLLLLNLYFEPLDRLIPLSEVRVAVFLGLGALAYSALSALPLTRWGWTLGCWIHGVRVVGEDRSATLSFKRALWRQVLYSLWMGVFAFVTIVLTSQSSRLLSVALSLTSGFAAWVAFTAVFALRGDPLYARLSGTMFVERARGERSFAPLWNLVLRVMRRLGGNPAPVGASRGGVRPIE